MIYILLFKDAKIQKSEMKKQNIYYLCKKLKLWPKLKRYFFVRNVAMSRRNG